MTLKQWIDDVTMYLEDNWGLNSDLAQRVSYLLLWGLQSGFPMAVTSGFRDPSKQREMQARWDAGDRRGLAARPATNSKHSTTTLFGQPDAMAVDLSAGSDQNLRVLGNWAQNYLGLGWGGTFKNTDLVHFYI